ncbi:penicillin-binding protein 2A [Salsuginibacillus halophilus]|uniref:Penicillin-binding protein 2A n=1 Tax=Salsuginibacillus halophilus TaxID=517424 RepID=A0A2P8HG23_9BACI|nr:PBP1A family penicillin-binding protein [Salsuginibacillus halophilus]PSL45144.1 penicillin-binding protein 2A [Salsuginibacillus halophilus]
MNKTLFYSLLALLTALVVAIGTYATVLVAGSLLFDEEQLEMNEVTEVVDPSGETVAEIAEEERKPVEISEVPPHVQDAFIAVEDVRFYEHQGIDLRAIGRALYRDILAGELAEGGSTITQQLAKNAFLSHDQTFLRKTKEVLIAMHMERNYSKAELLEMYMNQIYFGHGAHGVQVASERYFQKDVSALNEAEAALLAALPKGPNLYSPARDPERAEQRRNLALGLMLQHEFIDEDTFEAAEREPVPESVETNSTNAALLPYLDMVYEEAEDRYGLTRTELRTGGYQVQVPMNTELQISSYEKFQNDSYFPGNAETIQGAFVLMDHSTGGVQAVQGGRNYESQGLNRAQVHRQPGSILKPLAVYAPALETGMYHPYSQLKDERLEYDDYAPRNHDDVYEGEVTMREAVAVSKNTSAIWLLNEMGLGLSHEFMDSLGMPIEEAGLEAALGALSEGFTPVEMAEAYSVFSNHGTLQKTRFIDQIEADGDQIAELESVGDHDTEQVLSTQSAWYMTEMMQDVVQEGTGSAGQSNHALAGKTGTTSFGEAEGVAMDAWFAGYTPEYTGVLWMGFDRTSEEEHLEGGSSYAAELFKEILNDEQPSSDAAAFQPPEGATALEPPIDMGTVNDLQATFSFQGEGLFNVDLTWDEAGDERMNYELYEVSGGQSEKIATIEGASEYRVNGVNLFSLKEYMVVPVNPQTEEEGPPSNVARVELGLF